MEVTAKVYLEVQDGDVVTTVTDVVVTINESDVTINDSSFPSALTGMFKSAVVDEMKVAVAGAVDKAAPANVSAFTAALEEPYEVDLPAPFGQKVSVEPVFEDISVDTGGLLATLGAKVACDDSWDAEHGVPLTPGQMPDSTGAAGISSSIADDVMGLVLLDAWEHGMLVDHTLDHEGMSDLGMWPLAPPYDIIGLAAAPEAEEHLKVYAGDVLVTLPMGSLGDASFWVAAEAAVTVEPDSETGSVLVLQTAPDRVKASVEMVTAPEGLDQAGLVTLVQSAFATIFAKSVSGMEAVPLPEIPLSGFPDLASYAELQDRAIVVGSPQIDVPAGSQGYLEAQGEMVTPE